MNVLSSLRPAARISTRAFSTTRPSLDLCKMQLIGRIGAEPVMKQTKNGKDFLIYKVATTDAGIAPKDGEPRPEPTTSWHTIFAYGPSIERLAQLEKGTLVHVEANFTVTNEKTEDGQFKTSIFANHDRLTVIRRPTPPAPAEEE